MPDAPICKCGATESRPGDASRCRNGHARPGHAGPALKHGVASYRDRGELPPDLKMSLDEFRTQVVEDQGGRSELTALQAAYVTRLSELEAVCRLIGSDLATRGVLTPRGRVRGVFGKWLDTLHTWDRFAQRVGVTRRPKQIESLDQALHAVALPDEPPHV